MSEAEEGITNLITIPMLRPEIQKPRKVRGAYHNPAFTKVTLTERQHRKKNKIERKNRKANR